MKYIIIFIFFIFNISSYSAFSYEKLIDKKELVKHFTIKEIENIDKYFEIKPEGNWENKIILVEKDKPNKTITVLVERKYQQPVLKKVIKAKKKYSAHDENNTFKNGDKVSIRECKPFSKTKKFEVVGDIK